jgi:hypothetical protein
MGAVIDVSQPPSTSEAVVLRLTLHRREVYRVPRTECEVRVVSGTAWVPLNGEDKFLQRGDRIKIASTLICHTGDEPLSLEIRLPSTLSYQEVMRRLTRIASARRVTILPL